MSEANTPIVPEVPPNADDTPTHPTSSLAPIAPVHPMPTNFPEVRLPANPAPPVPAVIVPVATDPHSIHDGRGYQPERLVCVRCGSTNLARGQVVQYSNKFQNSFFAPRRLSLRRLNSLLNLLPFRSLVKLDALACRDCGAVLLVVDPSTLRKAEHNRE
jgi:hypothetical protein